MRKLSNIFLFSLLMCGSQLSAQVKAFSMVTDLGILRNFRKGQSFWAPGQTLQVQFHTSPKNAIYTWASYYASGKVVSAQSAIAKSPSTNPQTIGYSNKSLVRFKHISVGGKHYFTGDAFMEEGGSIYGLGGFGVILGRVTNSYSVLIDTSLYSTSLPQGNANFKRLTLDLGLGYERSIGGMLYLYTDLRFWIPTTDYPSPYLTINRNAPLPGMLNIGVRVLFD